MGSGSGKEPDHPVQEPVHPHAGRKHCNAVTSPWASSPPAPPAAPLERPLAGGGGGGRDGSSSAAAAAVHPKGKKLTSDGTAPTSSAAAAGVHRKGKKLASGATSPTRSAAAAGIHRKGKLASGATSPISSAAAAGVQLKGRKLAQILSEPHSPFVAQTAGGKVENKKPEEKQVKSSSHANLSLWSTLKRIFHREGREICAGHWQTYPITEAREYYFHPDSVTGQGVGTNNVNNHLDAYSEFRPVTGDEDCFYRSFIFSYLEQVLGRRDTHEEHSLLDAVKRLSKQDTNLGLTSEFCRSYEGMHNCLTVVACHYSFLLLALGTNSNLKFIEFKKLIKKVNKLKRQDRWKWNSTSSSTSCSCKEKLVKLFRDCDTTENIIIFLRYVVAMQICSHRKEYEPLIPELRGNFTLKDWCFLHLRPSRQYTQYVMMVALAEALEVLLRVERLSGGPAQVIYTGPGAPHVSVTLLYTGDHYGIIYSPSA